MQVLTAIGERDIAVTETERRAGAALHQMTDVEGLTLAQAVDWCGDDMSVKEATRLRRLSTMGAKVDVDDGEATAENGEPSGPGEVAAGQGGGVRAGTATG